MRWHVSQHQHISVLICTYNLSIHYWCNEECAHVGYLSCSCCYTHQFSISPALCFLATFGNVHFHFIHQRQNANTPALQMVRGEGEEGRKGDLCDLFIHYSTVHGKSSLYMIDLPGFDYNTQLTFFKSGCVIQEKG